MKLLLRFSFVFIIFLSSTAIGQIRFSAIPSSTQIGKNDRIQIDFKVENANVDNIAPPNFTGFVIESGPFSQSGMTNINGSVSRYYSMSFVLRPVRTGKLTIGSARAQLEGKMFTSKPITIQVTAGASGNSASPYSPFAGLTMDVPEPQPSRLLGDFILKKGENLQDKVNRNLFVKVDVDKTSCYVGEPVVATYKLYTRLKSESNLTKSPSFNGFSVVDLEVGNNYELKTETLNGREYSVYVLRKVQLYPHQAGIIELESCEVENSISFLRDDYAKALGPNGLQDLVMSFAGSSLPPEAVENVKTTTSSKVVSINVKALPEVGKPASFKGAVGDFKLVTWIVKPNMSTDDAGNLRVTLTGSGNLHLVNGVNILWPQGMDGFEPKISETLDKTIVPVSGEKQYAYPFSVSKAGKYIVPPFEFSFFNPKTGTYKVLNASVLEVAVTKGRGISRSKVKADGSDSVEASDVLLVLLYIACGLAIVVATSLFFINSKKKKDTPKPNQTIKENLVQKDIALKEIEPEIPISPLIVPQQKLVEGDALAFFSTLNQSLKEYLSKKLQVPIEELNKKKISEQLDKIGVNVHTSQLACSLLDDIEMNLYAAPFAAHVHMQEVYEKANELLGLFEKQAV